MIAAIIPLKETSVRVPNKNFRKFGDTTLAELKIRTLQKVEGLRIIVNTDSDKIIDRLSKYDIDFIKRHPYYTTCSGSEFFENIAFTADADVLMYAPCTAPFIKPGTIQKAIDIYNKGKFDSVVSVLNLQEHIWRDNRSINYDPFNAPNSHELQGTYVINYGFGIISREMMIKNRNIATENSYFYEVSDSEGLDIDSQLEFNFAQWMYEQSI